MKNIGCAKKNERKEIEIFSWREVELILDCARRYKPDYFYLFLILFRTGMRLGEALALQWEDVDFHSGVILVRKSWRNSVMSATKTGKSRQVDMSSQLSAELLHLKMRRKREAIRKGMSQPVEAVFHDRSNGHLSQNSVRNVWKRVLDKSGVGYRKVHTTRHTFASMMLSTNVPISYVSKMLGHSSIQMTVDIYGHLLPDRDRSAVNILDNLSANSTPMAPAEKENPATYEDYGVIQNLVGCRQSNCIFIYLKLKILFLPGNLEGP